ncbi:hypothetical protein MVI01_72680 [Myxococcus virescens]|uniref:Uncharacterized protein n=1 Tax=Myxococcus virescens TaxID=83456 RepID=A0A511HQ37_9BACT|nr:hypothetical protein MVI01_72680 [Myxococcus virescens]
MVSEGSGEPCSQAPESFVDAVQPGAASREGGSQVQAGDGGSLLEGVSKEDATRRV